MFRSPVNILLYVLCPVLVSSILISAFSSLMENYKAPDDFNVGYIVEEGSRYGEAAEALARVGKESGVNFILYESGNPEARVPDLGSFQRCHQRGCIGYKHPDGNT